MNSAPVRWVDSEFTMKIAVATENSGKPLFSPLHFVVRSMRRTTEFTETTEKNSEDESVDSVLEQQDIKVNQ
jgi:hypothetical protein